jgi:hypothetical protein
MMKEDERPSARGKVSRLFGMNQNAVQASKTFVKCGMSVMLTGIPHTDQQSCL